jgi:hypothetical protein
MKREENDDKCPLSSNPLKHLQQQNTVTLNILCHAYYKDYSI